MVGYEEVLDKGQRLMRQLHAAPRRARLRRETPLETKLNDEDG